MRSLWQDTGKVHASQPSGPPQTLPADPPPEPRRGRLPLAWKVLYSLWAAVWVPVYWTHNGPANFLWICDLGNFAVLAGLWLESRLLMSVAAAGVLFLQFLWAVDFLGRLVLGFHPIGGTDYMFDAARPLFPRLLSLFHLWIPLLIIPCVRRLGYDRRAFSRVAVAAFLLYPASVLAAGPEKNLNWVWKPFGLEQTLMPPALFAPVAAVLYLVLVVWPSHRLLLRIWGRPSPDGDAS